MYIFFIYSVIWAWYWTGALYYGEYWGDRGPSSNSKHVSGEWAPCVQVTKDQSRWVVDKTYNYFIINSNYFRA